MIELNIDGIEDIRRTFARLVPEAKAQALAGLADAAYRTARFEADGHTQTGALVQSLSLKPEGADAWTVGHDLRRAPHALFVHWGTKPHDIRPKERKALRWVHGNGFVFARFARHPGYAGDPYLETAADAAVRDFPRIVDQINLEGRW